MSLFYTDKNFYSQVGATATVSAPSGSQNGDIIMIVQSAFIAGFDAPAGFKVALGKEGFTNLSAYWGILGEDFVTTTYNLVGNSLNTANVCVIRITGVIDNTCEVIVDWLDHSNGDRTSFPSPDLTTLPPNRPRLCLNLGAQQQSESNWIDYRQGDFDDPLDINFVSPGTGNTISFGLGVFEDNAAVGNEVRGNNYYPIATSESGWRATTMTLALIGPVLPQTDLLSPAQAF